MKYLILLIFSLLLFSCSNGKKVYWCGDHACVNNKEKETYFKKTMIVEIKELSKQNKKSKSDTPTTFLMNVGRYIPPYEYIKGNTPIKLSWYPIF